MVRYTDADIGRAFNEKYFPRVEAVTDVLRLAPLNQNEIYTIVNSSSDFMIVCNVRQQSLQGVGLAGIVEDEICVCRELLLSKNEQLSPDELLVHVLAGIPLDVQSKPFFYVAYDQPTIDYIREHSKLEKSLPKAEIRRTKKEISFYLAEEKDINGVFPVRISLI